MHGNPFREKVTAGIAILMATLASALGWKVEEQREFVALGRRQMEMDVLRRNLSERATIPETVRYLTLLEQAERWSEASDMCAWVRSQLDDPDDIYLLMEACLRAARASSVDDLTWASPTDRAFFVRRSADLERARAEAL